MVRSHGTNLHERRHVLLLSLLPHERLLHVPGLLRGAGTEPGTLGPVQLGLVVRLAGAVGRLAVLWGTREMCEVLITIKLWFNHLSSP